MQALALFDPVPPPLTLSADEAGLVAAVLGGPRAEPRARELLLSFSGLAGLARAGLAELVRAGLSPALARRLRASLELGRRSVGSAPRLGETISSARDVDARLRARMVDLEQEELHVLGLDVRNRVVCEFVAGIGTQHQIFITPRDVYRRLVREAAHGAVIAHNHPSGDPRPSECDVALTTLLHEAGALVGVELVDHVVLAREGRYSFAEAGRWPP